MSMFNKCLIHLCDCTWLNMFHILNFCWSNTKRFLSLLVVFGKVFYFYKNCKKKRKKISKTVLPYSSDLVAGLSSHMPQSRALLKRFSRPSGGSMSQSRKRLRKFFINSVFFISCDSVWWLVHGWKLQSWGYLEIFTAPFMTFLWVDLLVTKNT